MLEVAHPTSMFTAGTRSTSLTRARPFQTAERKMPKVPGAMSPPRGIEGTPVAQ